jgi:hypothetical protein
VFVESVLELRDRHRFESLVLAAGTAGFDPLVRNGIQRICVSPLFLPAAAAWIDILGQQCARIVSLGSGKF